MTTIESRRLHPDAVANLRESISGTVVVPSDPGYERASVVFSSAYGLRSAPAIIVQVTDADDVGVAISFARSHELELSVRSGGHSGSGFSTNVGGLVIDMRQLQEITVLDAGRRLVRIGPGAVWGDVATKLGTAGLALTSGDTTTVGVGGLTLGGGIGWLVRKYGLALDSLVAASVVTADSELLHVSATRHADLFWAIRGGGGNFGVVTSFTFEAQPLDGVIAGTMQFENGNLARLLTGWRDVMRTAPEELNTTFLAMPDFPGMPGGVQLLVCYGGTDAAAADAAIAPLRNLPGLRGDDIAAKAYADILEEEHPPDGITMVGHNAFAPVFSDDAIAALATMYDELGGSVLMIRSLSGAFTRVPSGTTAFGFRDSEVLVIAMAFLPPDAPPEAADRVEELWEPVKPYVHGTYGGFSNAPDGEDPALLYPAENLERLVAIKRIYDPENLFRRNHNISTEIGRPPRRPSLGP